MAKQLNESRAVSFGLYFLLFVASLIVQLVWSYLNPTSRFGDLFVQWSDFPASIPRGTVSPVFGSHFFGDLLDGIYHVDKFPSGSYFGVGYLLFWFLRAFDYRTAFFLYSALAAFLCFVNIKRWITRVSSEERLMVYALNIAYPFIFSFDRGQVHLIVAYLLGIGLSFSLNPSQNSQDLRTGNALMALAFSVKIYLIFVCFAFDKSVLGRKSRSIVIVLMGISSLTFIAMATVIDFEIDFRSAQSFYDQRFASTIKYNGSLGGLVYQINPQKFSQTSYIVVYVCYLFGSLAFLRSKSLEFFERLLAITILTNSISPIAGIYVQTTICMVALVALSLKSTVALWRWRLYWFVVFVSIIPLNVPFVKDSQGIQEFRFQNTVVPVVQHGYVTALLVLGFVATFKRFPIIANRIP